METSRTESQDEAVESAPQGETMESLLAQQDTLSKKLTSRNVTWVKVISVTKDQVLVDIGEKKEGVVPLADFAPATAAPARKKGEKPAVETPQAPAVGQRIPVLLVAGSSKDGATQLSFKRARAELAWETVAKAFAEKARVRGQVTSAIKGGFLVDVGGVTAFLPASHADLRPVRNPAGLLNTGVRCYVLEINEGKKQIVISRKAVLEEESGKRKTKLLSELRVGEVRIGRVVAARPEGLIVDIGGAEGFVRSSDIAWGTPKPGLYDRGSKVKVKVLGKPPEGEKIPLGIKQLTANPADGIRKKYPLKTILRGKAAESAPAGLKIRLDNGDGAFCPLAECGEGATFKPGEDVSAVVIGVDPATLDLLVSIARFGDIQDRKRMAQYLKAPPPLTLGQLLSPDEKIG